MEIKIILNCSKFSKELNLLSFVNVIKIVTLIPKYLNFASFLKLLLAVYYASRLYPGDKTSTYIKHIQIHKK
jgi:hypothetical protein